MSSHNNNHQELSQASEENNFHNAFLIIPAYVTDNPKIDDATAMLFGRLNALSNQMGYSFAGDKYLAKITKVSEREVKNRLKTLENEGYIKRITKRKGMGWDRKIYTCNNFSQIPKTKEDSVPLRSAQEFPSDGNICSPYINNSNNINKETKAKKDPVAKATLASEDAHPSSDKYEIKLSNKEKEKLYEKLGKEETQKYIENLKLYLISIGKPQKYKSHYATILLWFAKDNKKPIISQEFDNEKLIIEKINNKYHKYMETINDQIYANNSLDIMDGYIVDRKRNFKAKLSLKKYLDTLLNGVYINQESFKNFAKEEFIEAQTILKCSNIGSSQLFKQ